MLRLAPYFVLLNTGLIAFSYSRLSAKIRGTQEAVLELVRGGVREVGPVEAQEQALVKQATEKALIRKAERTRSIALNL